MDELQAAVSRRGLGFLTTTANATTPGGLVRTIAAAFDADLVSLQALTIERRLVTVAWHCHSTEVEAALSQDERTRDIPEVLDTPSPAHACGSGSQVGSPFRALPRDAWLEHIGLLDEEQRLQGILTIVGTPSEGCPPLSQDERRILKHSCALVLAAASQTRRANRLERQLESLTQISQGLASRKTIYERLKAAVAAAQGATGFDSIQLLTWDPTGNKLLLDVLYIRDAGFVPDTTWDRLTREEIQESSKRFLADPSPMFIQDPAELETVPPQHRRWMQQNGITSLVFVPLIFEGEHLGTVVITSHFSRERTEERIRSLTALGGHLAAILQLSLLLAEVEEAYQRLQHSHRKTIETLALAAEMRDATTGRHLKQLERTSLAIGKRLGLSREDLKNLTLGAVVHDIGKLHVPDSVLLKRGPLTGEERALMRKHPIAGEQILFQSDIPEEVRQVARWHHERWDGAGYPDGLAAAQIPLAVQIVTVADVFDALISKRPYKEAWPYDRAIEEIKRSRETQLSPVAVGAFLDIIEDVWKGGLIVLDDAA